MDSRRMNQFDDHGKPYKKGRKGNGKPSKKKGGKSVGQGNGKPSKEETSRKSLGQGKEKTMDFRRMNQFDGNAKPSKEGTSRKSLESLSPEALVREVCNWSSYAEWKAFVSHNHEECFSPEEDDPIVGFVPPSMKRFIAKKDPVIDEACPTTLSSEEHFKMIERIALASSSDDSETEERGVRMLRLRLRLRF